MFLISVDFTSRKDRGTWQGAEKFEIEGIWEETQSDRKCKCFAYRNKDELIYARKL